MHTLNAADAPVHDTSLYLGILFLLLFILSIYAFFVKKCDSKNELLQKKEKEIIELHKHYTELEKESIQKISQKETEILSLNHNIADLKRTLQEGTKNQVVAKIETLQRKRQNMSNNTPKS